MKKFIFIFLIFFVVNSFSQEDYTTKPYSKEYNELMNYIPKSVVFDTVYNSNNLLFKKVLSELPKSIVFISTNISFMKSKLILSVNDNNILQKTIEDLATGLFLDGKKIIISQTGGYSGCTDKLIDNFKLKNTIITNLKFCYSCTGWNEDDFFIETFNSKMYELMKIKSPNYATYKFNGEFINKKQKSNFRKLILNKDRTFKLFQIQNNDEKIYSGFWENDEFILTLNLSKYKETEDLQFEYVLNRGKIIGVNEKGIKFKKAKKI